MRRSTQITTVPMLWHRKDTFSLASWQISQVTIQLSFVWFLLIKFSGLLRPITDGWTVKMFVFEKWSVCIKWRRFRADPSFVSAFESGQFVYFFFREPAVEASNCGKVHTETVSSFVHIGQFLNSFFSLSILEWLAFARTTSVVTLFYKIT